MDVRGVVAVTRRRGVEAEADLLFRRAAVARLHTQLPGPISLIGSEERTVQCSKNSEIEAKHRGVNG